MKEQTGTESRRSGYKAGVRMLLVMVVALSPGCSPEDDAPADEPQAAVQQPLPEQGPWDEAAEMRPDLMRVEPMTVTPGQAARLHFPHGSERGEAFVLEQQVEDGWGLRYLLIADHRGPHWTPVGEQWVWNDIGLSGPGPEPIIIPPEVEPDDYRICTANAPENFCAAVQVAPP